MKSLPYACLFPHAKVLYFPAQKVWMDQAGAVGFERMWVFIEQVDITSLLWFTPEASVFQEVEKMRSLQGKIGQKTKGSESCTLFFKKSLDTLRKEKEEVQNRLREKTLRYFDFIPFNNSAPPTAEPSVNEEEE